MKTRYNIVNGRPQRAPKAQPGRVTSLADVHRNRAKVDENNRSDRNYETMLDDLSIMKSHLKDLVELDGATSKSPKLLYLLTGRGAGQDLAPKDGLVVTTKEVNNLKVDAEVKFDPDAINLGGSGDGRVEGLNQVDASYVTNSSKHGSEQISALKFGESGDIRTYEMTLDNYSSHSEPMTRHWDGFEHSKVRWTVNNQATVTIQVNSKEGTLTHQRQAKSFKL